MVVLRFWWCVRVCVCVCVCVCARAGSRDCLRVVCVVLCECVEVWWDLRVYALCLAAAVVPCGVVWCLCGWVCVEEDIRSQKFAGIARHWGRPLSLQGVVSARPGVATTGHDPLGGST